MLQQFSDVAQQQYTFAVHEQLSTQLANQTHTNTLIYTSVLQRN